MTSALKKWLLVLLTGILFCGLLGCAEKTSQTPYALSQKILSLCNDSIEWKSLDGDGVATYYGMKKSLIKDFAAYVSDDDTSYNAVAVFAFNNKEERQAIANSFTEMLKSNKAMAGAVNPNEAAKGDKGIIMELENMLVLVLVENSDVVKQELLQMGAKDFSF